MPKGKPKKHLLCVEFALYYYKGNNRIKTYRFAPSIAIDNKCLEIIDNPKEILYITPLSKGKERGERK